MRCLDIPGSRYCCLVETLSTSHFEAWSWNQGHYRTNKERKRERALWSKARQTRTNTRIASSLPWATEMIFRFTFKHNWRAVLSLSSSLPLSCSLSLSHHSPISSLPLSHTFSLSLSLSPSLNLSRSPSFARNNFSRYVRAPSFKLYVISHLKPALI